MKIITATDGYKIGHADQYHQKTKQVVSNWTPRKSRLEGIEEVVFFGQQAFIKKFLIKKFNEGFFGISEDIAVNQYLRRINNYLPPGSKVTADRIRALHKLGYLPICILSLPEGESSPIRVPQSVIFATKDEFYWLVNYLETLASCELWKPCTSATIAKSYKEIFDKYAMETVGNTAFTSWQGHDFSMRGMSGVNDAMSSGAAHLLSFTGTDTIPAIDYLEDYYNANCEKELIGGSVAATEHAVMCSNTGFYIWDEHSGDWSKQGEAELSVFKALITETYPTGIVSIVSDTWDLWRVLTKYMVDLKDIILSRNGKIVIRPDSGNPVDILCGLSIPKFDTIENVQSHFYKNVNGNITFILNDKWHKVIRHSGNEFKYENYIPEPKDKGVIELLWDVFGGTITEKGYKLLNENVGAIYGDSITRARSIEICDRLKEKGFASINWVAGIGSYTYQYQTRDSLGYAQKSTYCEVGEHKIEIFKDPITDNGTKKSARGLTAVYKDENGKYYLKDQATWKEMLNCELVKVYENGSLLVDYTLQEIRDRVKRAYIIEI